MQTSHEQGVLYIKYFDIIYFKAKENNALAAIQSITEKAIQSDIWQSTGDDLVKEGVTFYGGKYSKIFLITRGKSNNTENIHWRLVEQMLNRRQKEKKRNFRRNIHANISIHQKKARLPSLTR